jgi:hypothetical protein
MIPTIVRSLGYDLLPAASRAAELLTQITQSPGLAPTASTATFLVLPSSTTCKVLVLEIWNAIGRNQWLNDLDDEHDQ